MALTGNRGEWAEIYAFFKLLSDGRIDAADENMNKIENTYFPILKIIREEILGQVYNYKTGDRIKILLNGMLISEIEVNEFKRQAEYVFNIITSIDGRSFSIDSTEAFMRSIFIHRIKEPGTHKADILMQIQEIHTGMILNSGFSIKSDFSSKAHLINASEATNFVYEIVGFNDEKMNRVNNLAGSTKIIDRLTYINENASSLTYMSTYRSTTHKNLIVIDSLMPYLLGEALIQFYTYNINSCADIAQAMEVIDPLKYETQGIYTYKLKKLLCACALGMKMGQPWDGVEEANGGYIVVKNSGEILAYHIYNRDIFENFLLHNTKFERGSTTKHNYCFVHKDNNRYFIRLNLAIRFK